MRNFLVWCYQCGRQWLLRFTPEGWQIWTIDDLLHADLARSPCCGACTDAVEVQATLLSQDDKSMDEPV
jgi:hypothetical protein